MCNYHLGVDTSAYTTSLAVIDENKNIIADYREALKVQKGKRGLRQQEAVFQHVKNLPIIMESLSKTIDMTKVKTVAASVKPRNQKDSYMPVFTVSRGLSITIASLLDKKNRAFTHQDGHIAAGIFGCNLGRLHKILALHISGGTTELLRITDDDTSYSVDIIGGTRDISVGQLIDRTGVLLGLEFPSGQYLENLIVEVRDKDTVHIPVHTKGTWLNFSGAETHLKRLIANDGYKDAYIGESLFKSIGEALAYIIEKAVEIYKIHDILVIGGVASNNIIRTVIKERIEQKGVGKIFIPDPILCTDNAVGIAYLGATKKGLALESF